MKKYNISPSQKGEWPSARKHGRWLRWSSALTVGLAVAAGISIPLDEKINKSDNEKTLTDSSSSENTRGEALESYTPTPFPESPLTSTNSGEIPYNWNIDTRLSAPNQQPTAESSAILTEAQPAARSENATPAQGSDTSSVESGTIQTSPQQAMLESPQAPAVGRIPPGRPLPTPTPTPYPIRSPG